MSYNYITDSHTNAVYKTTSPEGAKLIQRYMNQVGGSGQDWGPFSRRTDAEIYAERDRMAAIRRRAAAAAEVAAAEVAERAAGAVADLDEEFGPNTKVYNAVHDLTISRTLARLDSLISAIRNISP